MCWCLAVALSLPVQCNLFFRVVLGQVSAGPEAASRFRVVVPENANRLPPAISLASALLYSPRCLSRIRHYIKGKAAYIVPHIPGPEDKRLALLLRLPLFAGDPVALAPLYTKSGITRALAAADVATPPCATDIFDERELVSTLADLIMNNLDTDRWLLKACGCLEIDREIVWGHVSWSCMFVCVCVCVCVCRSITRLKAWGQRTLTCLTSRALKS
jgi:hypothetical protein